MLRNKQLTFELDSTLNQCLNLNLNLNPNPIQHWNLDLSSIQFNKNHDVAQMRDTTTKESIVKLLLFSLLSSSLPYLRLFRVWKPFVAYTRCVCVCVCEFTWFPRFCVFCVSSNRAMDALQHTFSLKERLEAGAGLRELATTTTTTTCCLAELNFKLQTITQRASKTRSSTRKSIYFNYWIF